MPWQYQPDPEKKHKKGWTENHAGFVKVGNSQVGKCPHNMDTNTCEKLLNHGVEFYPLRWNHDYPKRIYNIFNKVVYRATPTNPGVSYHGFPEDAGDARDLPIRVRNKILELAEQQECREEVEKWLKG